MKRHHAKALLASVFSAGWVVPLWLSVDTYFDFWQLVALPLALNLRPLESFPFLEFAGNCFGFAMLWLGLVVGSWAYIGYMAHAKRRAA